MPSANDAPLDWKEIGRRAAVFVNEHKDDSSEDADKQTFWNDFFEIFGVPRKSVSIYEKRVSKLEGMGKIDLFWPGTLVVEHKSLGKNLNSAFEQALDYTAKLKRSEMPKYIIVSDFRKFRLIDLENEINNCEFIIEELVNNIRSFAFIAGYESQKNMIQDPVNIKAAEKMALLHDKLKEAGYEGHDLEVYLVRLVFLLFADDAGIFEKNQFIDYVKTWTHEDGSNLASEIDTIFDVLNAPKEKRLRTLPEKLEAFPYVNGHLFSEKLQKAGFDSEMRSILLDCSELDWNKISPAVFGSLFQGVMDNELRRSLGAHYTSEENILKLINPLFMDDLRAEFKKIGNNPDRLLKFRDKLTGLKFLDPACGCGNFLIISYRELRMLEMDVMQAYYKIKKQSAITTTSVSVTQFYGIEIEDFPSEIARVAMWLMDHLMNNTERNMFGDIRPTIPLQTSANILCANSLKTDWADFTDVKNLDKNVPFFIIGNPPFIGSKMQNERQREDMKTVFLNRGGVLDYVSAWYETASKLMVKYPWIRTGFVSTNSITQGEQVAALWKPIFERGIKINFAYHTFKWSNEARGKAAVFVVIIGFSKVDTKCRLYDHSEGLTGIPYGHETDHINAYLAENIPDIFIESRNKPICNVSEIGIGNKPIDGGNYIFTEEEKKGFIEKEPGAEEYFRKFIGSDEFINRRFRYILLLKDCPPEKLRKMPEVVKRVNTVKQLREKSISEPTRKLASTPTRFHVENIPTETYIAIPETSSETREYVPIGFVNPDILSSNAIKIVPNATIYDFGILTSSVHNNWMRVVGGRLKSDYRYSVKMVYNNFPWPEPTGKQRAKIKSMAQKILDTRELYQNSSLADLYDPISMPPDLTKAHRDLDAAVMEAYGFKKQMSESRIVAELMKKYDVLTRNDLKK